MCHFTESAAARLISKEKSHEGRGCIIVIVAVTNIFYYVVVDLDRHGMLIKDHMNFYLAENVTHMLCFS